MSESVFESTHSSFMLPFMVPQTVTAIERAKAKQNGRANKLDPQDRAFHDWYRFVLSFPPHLVRSYLEEFELDKKSIVLDPFCGTGTTLIEAKLSGISSMGTETNAFAQFASATKVDWKVDPGCLRQQAYEIAEQVRYQLKQQGIDDEISSVNMQEELPLRKLSVEGNQLLLTNSISPLPLHKTLVLLDCLKERQNESSYRYQLLALANMLVFKASNLQFGPEVGIGKPKMDAPILSSWLAEIDKMTSDISFVADREHISSKVCFTDARYLDSSLPHNSVDAVITSPPYPNEKDYTRITRLESVILGFISNKADLRNLKKGLLRSNTRNVYKGDDDDKWVTMYPEIQHIAEAIESRRIELGKTSGFEKLYSKVTKLYFGGIALHLASLRKVLRPNAQLAYVVGDQASYLRVMIRTGKILGEIAQSLGYELVRTDLFRTRLSTVTKEQLREEVVILRWRG